MMEAGPEPEHPAGSGCCFCFTTTKKSVASTKGKSGGVLSSDQIERGKNDELLSDMSTFSVKEQERRLRKALEEEDRVSREAERVVQWVKQESAKIDVSTIKTILSDEEKEVTANYKKSLAKKRSKSREVSGSTSTSNQVEHEKKDVIVTGFSKFGVMEQENKLMKKALEEEQRISKKSERKVRFVNPEAAS